MIEVSDTIEATPRSAGHKGDARKLRRAGAVPAVIYGPGHVPSYVAVDHKQFMLQRTRLGSSHIYDVRTGDAAPFKAMIKEIQRCPVTQRLLHVDLYRVDMSREIRVEVPLELTGKAAGLIDGGLVSQILRTVTVQCLPDRVPAKLLADVTPLKVGDSLHLADLQLPEGVRLTSVNNEAVVQVVEPEAAPAATEPAAAAAAAPAAAAPAAAKPAAKK